MTETTVPKFWGIITNEKNDFYPEARIVSSHMFTLHISEPERMFLFPRELMADQFYTEGDTTDIVLELHTLGKSCLLLIKYVSELNRTYYIIHPYSRAINPKEGFLLISAYTKRLPLPIQLECYLE